MIEQLPTEILNKILEHFSTNELLLLRLLNSRWNGLVMQHRAPVFHIRSINQQNELEQFKSALWTLTNSIEYTIVKHLSVEHFNGFPIEKYDDKTFKMYECIIPTLESLRLVNCQCGGQLLKCCWPIMSRSLNKLQILSTNLYIYSDHAKWLPTSTHQISLITDLDLKGSTLNDWIFVQIAENMSNLKKLNCQDTNMYIYENYIRRFYRNPMNLTECWRVPTTFKLTLSIILYFIQSIANVEHIHLGPMDNFRSTLDVICKLTNHQPSLKHIYLSISQTKPKINSQAEWNLHFNKEKFLKEFYEKISSDDLKNKVKVTFIINHYNIITNLQSSNMDHIKRIRFTFDL